MNALDIILKKRSGEELSADEIRYFINGYTAGEIPDYQASALLMAVYFNGMTKRETFDLTEVMRTSGDVMDLSRISGVKVDKHSTGGVGDKVSLCVAPVAAACGVKVAKMSGRGLGHTGGTIDKLESFPGFNVSLSEEQFFNQVEDHGIAIMAQTGDVAPADKKLYALRDVTGTVENMSLIASSIMSKKLAAGSDAIVLDVKCGSGAFMKTEEDARSLASEMIEIGKRAGRKTVAVISDMEQPLGRAVGNALEVKEAIDVLNGKGPADITELSLTISGLMIWLADIASSPEEGRSIAAEAILSGAALDKLKEFVKAQGGDETCVDDPEKLDNGGSAKELCMEVKSPVNGYVMSLDALKIGTVSQHIGAGRLKKDDVIDLSAGIILEKKCGERVENGDVLARLYGRDRGRLDEASREVLGAYGFSSEEPEEKALIKDVLGL
ncbi:MAG: pyrimidine-nucleoside phosphorylase [Eubacterium sp.]|nr:pyrimidine-nucleoside phosphorylase [Eubacterium sp.]